MEKNALLDQLMKKNIILCYVKIDELYDILYEIYSATGHRGRNRMISEPENKYGHVTNETVMVLLKL